MNLWPWTEFWDVLDIKCERTKAGEQPGPLKTAGPALTGVHGDVSRLAVRLRPNLQQVGGSRLQVIQNAEERRPAASIRPVPPLLLLSLYPYTLGTISSGVRQVEGTVQSAGAHTHRNRIQTGNGVRHRDAARGGGVVLRRSCSDPNLTGGRDRRQSQTWTQNPKTDPECSPQRGTFWVETIWRWKQRKQALILLFYQTL